MLLLKLMEKSLKSEKQSLKSDAVSSFLFHDRVVVDTDFSVVQSLHDRGWFGTVVKQKLELSLCEALYLLERGKIVVFDVVKKPLTVTGFIRKARLVDLRFPTRFKVYSDIRSRGYITKEALKFGADFSVYERGTNPQESHSKWLLFAVSSDDSFNWREFSAMNRVAHSVKKELLVGILDAHADVTYYSIAWQRP